MELNRINRFCEEMEQAGRAAEHFDFSTRKATLIVLITVEQKRVSLLLGVTGFDPKVKKEISRLFLYRLERPCRSQRIEEEDYDLLVRILATPWNERVASGDGKRPEPFNLFGLIDANTPDHLPTRAFDGVFQDVFPKKMIDIAVQDADKIYFCGVRTHQNDGKRVSAQNLAKTLLIGGCEAEEYCSTYNVSTCWTADPQKARKISEMLKWQERIVNG